MASHRNENVPSATNLPTSASADLSHRQRNYMVSMLVRTICFVLGVVLTGPLRWVCFGLAIVLPYIAVVAANASNSRTPAVRGRSTPRSEPKRIEPSHYGPYDESA